MRWENAHLPRQVRLLIYPASWMPAAPLRPPGRYNDDMYQYPQVAVQDLKTNTTLVRTSIAPTVDRVLSPQLTGYRWRPSGHPFTRRNGVSAQRDFPMYADAVVCVALGGVEFQIYY